MNRTNLLPHSPQEALQILLQEGNLGNDDVSALLQILQASADTSLLKYLVQNLSQKNNAIPRIVWHLCEWNEPMGTELLYEVVLNTKIWGYLRWRALDALIARGDTRINAALRTFEKSDYGTQAGMMLLDRGDSAGLTILQNSVTCASVSPSIKNQALKRVIQENPPGLFGFLLGVLQFRTYSPKRRIPKKLGPTVRATALRQLARFRNLSVVPLCIEEIADKKNPDAVRRTALIALNSLSPVDALPHLWEGIEAKNAVPYRSCAARLLIKTGDPAAKQRLTERILDPDESYSFVETLVTHVPTLYKTDSDAGIDILVQVLSAPGCGPIVVLDALSALNKFPHSSVFPALIGLLHNPNLASVVRVGVAKKLQEFPTPIVIEALQQVLDDPDISLVIEAAKSLQYLCSADALSDIIRVTEHILKVSPSYYRLLPIIAILAAMGSPQALPVLTTIQDNIASIEGGKFLVSEVHYAIQRCTIP